MKRILTVQDISCVGKCSLTVALPILSAMGLETAIIPTAVLSAHTAFPGFTFHDLTDEIPRIAAHWSRQGLSFDGIYTGYLGSFRQLELMEGLFDEFGGGKLLFVDPCMGDSGSLYTGFTPAFARRMAQLCSRADVIAPNMTEACFLTDERCPEGEVHAKEAVERLLSKLSALGAKCVILKGVTYRPGECTVISLDTATGHREEYTHELIPRRFHGTGDIFASAAFGSLCLGKTVAQAVRLAADFTLDAIRRTVSHEGHNWYGVDFEAAIPTLVSRLA